MSTTAQFTANRENAQHSTGPTSAEGRAASSQNARTHGLRSEHLTHFSLEEQKQYQEWCESLRSCLLPGNAIEEELFRQMSIHGWKARQGEALFSAVYNIAILDEINSQFDAAPENRVKFDLPGATAAETLAAAQQDPQLAAHIYVLGMRRRPSILTLQRMITSHENAFTRRRKELERLISERREQERFQQVIDSQPPTESAQTNPIPPQPAPKIGRNTPCPCKSGLKFKRCCLNKPAAA